MFFSKTQVISIFSALAVAQASSLQAPIAGYGVEEFVWSVTPTHGGAAHEFKGPVEHVIADAIKVNPTFYHDFNLSNAHPAEPDRSASLAKRGDTWNCDPRHGTWIFAYYEAIRDGIRYLRTVPGQPQRGPGPGSCGRVSCSYQSAIWWCNDNTYTKVLPSFNSIADSAQLLVDKCLAKDPIAGAYKFVKGQVFHDDGWNVIVRLDNDNC